jgi:hypothetical protein
MTLILIAVGVVSGVIYTLSPLTVFCLAWIALVARHAVTGVTGHERRWVLAVVIAAATLRCAVIGALPLIHEAGEQRRARDAAIALQRGHGDTVVVATTLYDTAPEASLERWRAAYGSYAGDGEYAIQRSIWIRNIALGIPVAPRDYTDALEPVFGWSRYNYLLAFLHIIFGSSPYGIALVSAAMFLTAAAMLYRVCRGAFGGLAALGGVAVVLFMPTLIAWSVMPLKEAAQFLLLASCVVAMVGLIRGSRPVRIGSAACLLVALECAGTLRAGGMEVGAIGVGFGTLLWLGARRIRSAVVVVAVLAVATIGAAWIPAVQTAVSDKIHVAANRQRSYVQTAGTSFKALDEKYYSVQLGNESAGPIHLNFDEAERFLLRSVIGFVTQPPPIAESPAWLALIPQQVVWYCAVLLAFVGAIRGMWRQPMVTSLLLGMIVGGVIIIAPNSGNIGTLIRHRDMIVPFVLMLASYGAVTVIERVAFDGCPSVSKGWISERR